MKKILVTGVLGFIGSYFAKYVLSKYENYSIVGVGRNTDQGNFKRIKSINDNPRFKLVMCDIAKDDVSELYEGIDYAINFAGKTYVDHSIRDPKPFIESNIIGTYRLLEEAKKARDLVKHIQISTDEVYGAILKGAYDESAPLNPTNPYSATKASADMLAVSFYNTYKTPIIVSRTENVYGPFQHPQKAIPTFVRKALNDEPLPIYGDGMHVRQWIHVEDKCRALLTLLEKGEIGEIYHIAGSQELQNIELGKTILRILNKPEDTIEFIDDWNIRPGHDRRYALSSEKIRALGWQPKYDLKSGIENAVLWYKENGWWFI